MHSQWQWQQQLNRIMAESKSWDDTSLGKSGPIKCLSRSALCGVALKFPCSLWRLRPLAILHTMNGLCVVIYMQPFHCTRILFLVFFVCYRKSTNFAFCMLFSYCWLSYYMCILYVCSAAVRLMVLLLLLLDMFTHFAKRHTHTHTHIYIV